MGPVRLAVPQALARRGGLDARGAAASRRARPARQLARGDASWSRGAVSDRRSRRRHDHRDPRARFGGRLGRHLGVPRRGDGITARDAACRRTALPFLLRPFRAPDRLEHSVFDSERHVRGRPAEARLHVVSAAGAPGACAPGALVARGDGQRRPAARRLHLARDQRRCGAHVGGRQAGHR